MKLAAALLCTAAAGTFIWYRLRGPVPPQVDPAIEAAGGLMGRRTARGTDGASPGDERPDGNARPAERGASP